MLVTVCFSLCPRHPISVHVSSIKNRTHFWFYYEGDSKKSKTTTCSFTDLHLITELNCPLFHIYLAKLKACSAKWGRSFQNLILDLDAERNWSLHAQALTRGS